jgi:hypothetical protein
MAIWQFDLDVVPNPAVEANRTGRAGGAPAEYTEWSGVKLPSDYYSRLTELLQPSIEPWPSETFVFGETDGNRIDLITKNDGVNSFYIRLDLRALDRSFIEHLVSFVHYCGGTIVVPGRGLLLPDADALWRELELAVMVYPHLP